jgi:hypothetical protein
MSGIVACFKRKKVKDNAKVNEQLIKEPRHRISELKTKKMCPS